MDFQGRTRKERKNQEQEKRERTREETQNQEHELRERTEWTTKFHGSILMSFVIRTGKRKRRMEDLKGITMTYKRRSSKRVQDNSSAFLSSAAQVDLIFVTVQIEIGKTSEAEGIRQITFFVSRNII